MFTESYRRSEAGLLGLRVALAGAALFLLRREEQGVPGECSPSTQKAPGSLTPHMIRGGTSDRRDVFYGRSAPEYFNGAFRDSWS